MAEQENQDTTGTNFEKPEDLINKVETQAGLGETDPTLPEGTKYTPVNYGVKDEELLTQPDELTDISLDTTTVSTDVETTAPERTAAQTYQATKISDALPSDMQAAINEKGPSYQIGDIQGKVSPESLAKAQQGKVSPESLVSYQLSELYKAMDEDGPMPAWAAGATRNASALMAKRGLGSSSMAAFAITQALVESGLPIAKADADRYAAMDLTNLNNRQQTALQNAATVAAMDRANLDARMRAAQTNAQSFLAIDLANLDNQQKTNTINYQSVLEALYKDQAYENAAKQFNAESQQQVDQFYSALETEVEAANANRVAAMQQFNAGQKNAMAQYVSSMNDSRQKFNLDMKLQIDQSNTVWRRNVNTANTALQNEANRMNAQNLLGIQQSSLNALWQTYRDEVGWAIQMAENQLSRDHQIGMLGMQIESNVDFYNMETNDRQTEALGAAVLNGIFGVLRGKKRS